MRKIILSLAAFFAFYSFAFANAPSYIQVAPDGTGKKVDQDQITYSGNTVQRQIISIGDPATGGNVATVDASGRMSISFPNVTSTQTNPSITTSTSTALASNSSRKYALVQNTTATPAWMMIGSSATVGTGMYIGPYGLYEMSSALGNLDTRVINAISTSGTIAFAVLEAQ